jgi:hypothetical protein
LGLGHLVIAGTYSVMKKQPFVQEQESFKVMQCFTKYIGNNLGMLADIYTMMYSNPLK